MAFTK